MTRHLADDIGRVVRGVARLAAQGITFAGYEDRHFTITALEE